MRNCCKRNGELEAGKNNARSHETKWNFLALTWLVRCAPCDGSPRAAPSSSANPLFLLQQQRRHKIPPEGDRIERGEGRERGKSRRRRSPCGCEEATLAGLSRTARMWRPPIDLHTYNIYVAGERGYHWLCAVLTWTTGLLSRSSPLYPLRQLVALIKYHTDSKQQIASPPPPKHRV